MNIFAQYAQPVRSIQDYQADEDNRSLRREQLAGVQRQNALAELTVQQQMEASRQAREKQNALAALLRDPAIRDPQAREAAMLSHPLLMQEGLAAQRERLANEKVQAETVKLKSDAAAKDTDTAETKRKALLQQVAALRSPEDALALIDHGVQTQSLPAPIAAGLRNMIGTDPRWQLNLMLGIGDPSKLVDVLRPHLQAVNSGKTTTFVDTNAYTNPTGPAPVQMTTTPGEDLSAATQKRGQDVTAATAAAARAQADRHFNTTRQDAAKDVIYDPDRGVLVSKATGLARPAATMDGTPLGPKDKPLPEGAQKQIMGTRNLQDAVANYREKLAGFSKLGMLSPDARAEMGNAYNNMMLQAKEAYNLGVLNGPDYDILQAVVKDPTKIGAAITSKSALDAQAAELSRIAAGIEKTAMESHGKAYKPREQAGAKPSSSAPTKITDDAGYNALPSGATFIGPDGKTRRKP